MNKLFDILSQDIVKKVPLINGCLNYTGGKFKLLSQILPYFPKDINTFVDLFCGGCAVGLNVNCHKVIYNDRDSHVISLYQTFREHPIDEILDCIHKIILNYELIYKYDSGDRIKLSNNYLRLRDDYNIADRNAFESNIMLYVLIVFGMNNYIRYNSNDEFNMPVGKSDFNPKMKEKLIRFCGRIKEQNCRFTDLDFRYIVFDDLSDSDFIYCDPPYLITDATYNSRSGGWNEQDEQDLLTILDFADSRNIKFALSNVLIANGKENQILKEWLDGKKFNVHHLDFDYLNSNYQKKNKFELVDEVLITNY